MKLDSSAGSSIIPAKLSRSFAVTIILVLAPVASPQLLAQDYASPQYVQPNPNYIANPQPKPSPYGYPQQPAPGQQSPAPQQSYADPQYAQPQQAPDQADQQPYADAGPDNQPYAPQPQYPQQPAQVQQPLAADQLEQLVAPIALYPDNLVAQVLAAATYPAQVAAADNWLHAQGYASPDQIAYAADAQTGWDPSIKALTAFPQVLDLMNQDLRWTTDLGNAYYNQPQDVLQTIQVMRQRAENAGTLQSTPQEDVSNSQGYIQVAPVNPQVVYVPMYNPWVVYGPPLSPYPGFSLFGALEPFGGWGVVRFGVGIAIGAFSHTPFGWAGWGLNWLGSSIFFHQAPYYSHSTSVAHWGNGGYYGSRGGINRIPNGYGRPQQGLNRLGNTQGNAFARGDEYGHQQFGRPSAREGENYAYNRYDGRPGGAPDRGYAGSYVRPALPIRAFDRPQPAMPAPARQPAYAGGFGNRIAGNAQGYPARPAGAYAGQQAYRAPAQNYQRNDFAQRAYAGPQSFAGARGSSFPARSFAEPKQQRPGGSPTFAGAGRGASAPHFSYKAPRAPKMSGGGQHGGGSSGHHGR